MTFNQRILAALVALLLSLPSGAEGRVPPAGHHPGPPGGAVNSGTTEARTLTTTWHPRLDQPLTRSEASVLGAGSKVTIWDYDDDGNATANEAPTNLVHRKVEQGFTRDAAWSG